MANSAKEIQAQYAKKGGVYPYKSRFGSHFDMVLEQQTFEAKAAGTLESGMVICKDEYGEYITYLNRLDTGSSDPKRYQESRLVSLQPQN